MTSLASTPFVIVDLETTGGSAMYDRVMEVAAIRFENGVVQERLEPGAPTGAGLRRLTRPPVGPYYRMSEWKCHADEANRRRGTDAPR